MSTGEIVLYTQPGCDACERGAAWLRDRGVPARIENIRADDRSLFGFMDTGSRTTPTLVTGSAVLEGFNPSAWAAALGERP
jgi:arsenate reductase-like glutaredoxin family protein